jgi:hypothetical protein
MIRRVSGKGGRTIHKWWRSVRGVAAGIGFAFSRLRLRLYGDLPTRDPHRFSQPFGGLLARHHSETGLIVMSLCSLRP